MIADRVLTSSEGSTAFPGSLVGLRFPKKEPLQAYFVADGPPVRFGDNMSAVGVNFTHNLVAESRKITLSMSFDFGDQTPPAVGGVTFGLGADAETELVLEISMSDVVGLI